MTTLVGTFTLPDGTPERGTVHVTLAAAAAYQDAPPELVTPAGIAVELDEFGAFSVDLIASDDPLWATEDPVPYMVRVRLSGLRADWLVLVPTSGADVDLSTLAVLDGPPDVVAVPGPAPVLTVGDITAQALAHGETPTAAFTFTPGDPGEYELDAAFGIPDGATGPAGPPPTVNVGTVTATDVAHGTPPTAAFTLTETAEGVYDLDATFEIPEGPIGETGPPPELTVGTVTTGAPGSSVTFTLTETTPGAYTADVSIPAGTKGDTGNLAYWWRGAWVSGPYVEGDVVTNDGATWVCIADNNGLEPGAAPVTVAVGSVVQNGGSSGSISAGLHYQPFVAASDRWVTHVTVPRTDAAASGSIRDSSGVVLATYATSISTPGVMVALSAPVQLVAGQTYYLGVDTDIGYSATTVSGVVGSLPGTLRAGAWNGTPISNRYGLFTLHGDSVESWVVLAEKGDTGATGATGPANELSIGTVTTLSPGASATATISGTPPTQTLNLGIPQGAKGDTGNVAPSNVGNLVTANVATGTDTSSDTTGWSATGATIASSTDVALAGTRSLKVTATSAGAACRAFAGGSVTSGTIPVIGGLVHQLTFYARAASGLTNRQIGGIIYWWTSAGNVAASTASVTIISSVTLSDSAWVLAQGTAYAPNDAAFASIRISGVTGQIDIGNSFYLDTVGFWTGAGGLWVPPGVPVPHLGTRYNPSSTSQVQLWNDYTGAWVTV